MKIDKKAFIQNIYGAWHDFFEEEHDDEGEVRYPIGKGVTEIIRILNMTKEKKENIQKYMSGLAQRWGTLGKDEQAGLIDYKWEKEEKKREEKKQKKKEREEKKAEKNGEKNKVEAEDKVEEKIEVTDKDEKILSPRPHGRALVVTLFNKENGQSVGGAVLDLFFDNEYFDSNVDTNEQGVVGGIQRYLGEGLTMKVESEGEKLPMRVECKLLSTSFSSYQAEHRKEKSGLDTVNSNNGYKSYRLTVKKTRKILDENNQTLKSKLKWKWIKRAVWATSEEVAKTVFGKLYEAEDVTVSLKMYTRKSKKTGRSDNLEILRQNPRLEEYLNSYRTTILNSDGTNEDDEDKKAVCVEAMAALVLSSGVELQPTTEREARAQKKRWEQNLSNWMNTGASCMNMINRFSDDQGGGWLDLFSALEKQIGFFSRVSVDKGSLKCTETATFKNFLATYQHVMSSLDNKVMVPFYARSVEDIATAVAIYMGGGKTLKKELVKVMSDAMTDSLVNDIATAVADHTNVDETSKKELVDELVKVISKAMTDSGSSVNDIATAVANHMDVGETRQKNLIDGLVKVISEAMSTIEATTDIAGTISLRKRLEACIDRLFHYKSSTVKERQDMEQDIKDGLKDYAKAFRKALNIRKHDSIFVHVSKATHIKCVEGIREFKFSTKKLHKLLQDYLFAENCVQKDSLEWSPKSFMDYLTDIEQEELTGEISIGLKRAFSDTSKKKNKNAEDQNLMRRLVLLRMHLIVWECIHSEQNDDPDNVIRTINRVLDEAGFSELVIGDPDGPLVGSEFDYAIYQALFNTLDA